MSNYYLKIYKRLLREATQPVVNPFSYSDVGFVYKMSSEQGTGVAYNPKIIIDSLIDASSEYVKPIDFYSLRDFCQSSVLAFIDIKKPKLPCNGAWEVKASAARYQGEGKLAYAMGYHLSSLGGSGLLMPDRKGLSPYAREAWRKVRKKSAGKTLDNIRHPQKHASDEFNSDPFHDMYHTEETSDDCETWSVSYRVLSSDFASQRHGVEDEETQDAVNRTYAMGDMGYDFESMKRIHAESTRFIIDNFNFIADLKEDALEQRLMLGGEYFFSSRLSDE